MVARKILALPNVMQQAVGDVERNLLFVISRPLTPSTSYQSILRFARTRSELGR